MLPYLYLKHVVAGVSCSELARHWFRWLPPSNSTLLYGKIWPYIKITLEGRRRVFHYNSPKLERIWMKLCVGPQCTSHKKWGNCLHGFCQTAAKRVLFFFCHQYNMAFGTHILHRLDHVWNNSHESVSRSVHLWEISEFLHSCFASPKKLPLEALFWVGVLITSVQFKRHIFGWRESFQGLVDIPRMCLLDLDLWPFDLEQFSYMAGHVTNPATKFEDPKTIRSWVTSYNVSHWLPLKMRTWPLRMRRIT